MQKFDWIEISYRPSETKKPFYEWWKKDTRTVRWSLEEEISREN